jgi:hypothetical protein
VTVPYLQETFRDVFEGLEIVTVRVDPLYAPCEENSWLFRETGKGYWERVLNMLLVLYRMLRGRREVRLVSRFTYEDLPRDMAEVGAKLWKSRLEEIPRKKRIASAVWDRWVSCGLVDKRPDVVEGVDEMSEVLLFEVDLMAYGWRSVRYGERIVDLPDLNLLEKTSPSRRGLPP